MFVLILVGFMVCAVVIARLPLATPLANLLTAALTAGVLGGGAGLLIVGRPWLAQAAGLQAAPRREVLRAAVLALPLLPVFGGVATLVRWALGESLDNPQVPILFPPGMSGFEVVGMGLVVVGAVPVAEELVFRGVLLDALRERVGPGVAVVGSSVLFGLMHVELALVVATGLLGGVLGVLRLRSDSIWPAVALHSVNNGLALLAIVVTEGV